MKLPRRIQTARLVLRRLTPGDERDFAALLGARELFCCVTPRRRCNGYALEALRRVMEYCSAEEGVTGFRAYIDPDNRSGASLAQRLGMQSAGEEPHPSDGSNCMVYSIVIR